LSGCGEDAVRRSPDAAHFDAGQADTVGPGTDATTDAEHPSVVDGAGGGVDGGRGDLGQAPETAKPASAATIVVMPDTQYYSSSYPEVYLQQTSWILGQIKPLNIAAVLHVGDLVDGPDSATQWTAANTAMRVLDHQVPYLVVPGNHDTGPDRSTPMSSYFGPASMPWITGTMTPGQMENNYALFDIGPEQWLVLGLEFGPRDAVVVWADKILKQYADRPAIIVTHAYLYHDGNRYDINVSGLDDKKPNYQSFIPQAYHYTESQGINDGEMLWQKLVVPNRNVRMVFSGHDTGGARLTSTRPDGTRVHQMLSDYQWWSPDGITEWSFGFGWLRIVQLDYVKKTLAVQTYSPYLQQYLTDDANQFTLDWNL
jgi:3',5'-cyclic AMP phosphodiesterase CpdA